MKHAKKLVTMTVSAVAMAGLLAGPSAKAEDLKIGSSVHSLFSLPLYLAKEKGFFEEKGLNVEIINFTGGSTATPALLGGSVVLQSAATENMLKVVAAGQPIVAVMAVQSTLNGAIVVPDAVVERLGHKPTIEDAKGMRIGTLGRGGMADMAMRYIARDAGIDDSDITLMPMAPTALGPAMSAGDLDAALTVEPLQTLLVDGLGEFAYMVDMLEGEGPELFQDMGWITLQGKADWVEANSETVRKVVTAMVDAQNFVADEANLDEVARLMEPVFPNLPPPLLKQSIRKQMATYRPQITQSVLDKNNELLLASDAIESPVAFEDAVDESFADLWDAFGKQ